MAIRNYTEDGKKYFEVYVNGFDSRGIRVQRKRKGIETLRKAETTEFELMRELVQLKERKVSYRWAEWVHVCLKRMKMNSQPSTVINYQSTLNRWITPKWKDFDLADISREMVYRAIFESVDPKLKPNTRKCILKFVKRILQMAIEEGILDRNPCAGITVRVAEIDQKVLTNSEVEIFLKEAKAVNHRFYPVWVVALLTGMRSGELFALKWTDIDMDARIISVTRQWTSKNGFGPTKTRLSRVVPVSEELLAFLKSRKLQAGPGSEFVLPHLTEWSHGDQAKVIKDFCTAIGITPIKFHDLRATFITNLLSRGEALARVMSIVGHSELKTTNGYLRKAGVDVLGGTDKLGYKLPQESEGKVLSLVGRA